MPHASETPSDSWSLLALLARREECLTGAAFDAVRMNDDWNTPFAEIANATELESALCSAEPK